MAGNSPTEESDKPGAFGVVYSMLKPKKGLCNRHPFLVPFVALFDSDSN